MSKKGVRANIRERADLEHYHRIYGGLLNWRIDDFSRGEILPFVRGLYFSAQLIYTIRDILSETDLKANWGHLLDKDESCCSRECDIIIHRKGYCHRWNGHKSPIMDFKFIEQNKAVAVISCKSYNIKTGAVDKNYPRHLEPFVKKVWLFAECCDPKHTKAIEEQAKNAGYEKFWYMYKWSHKTAISETNEAGWLDFVAMLRRLKASQ